MWTRRVTQRAGFCSVLVAVYSYLWEGREQAEPDSSQRSAAGGEEATDTRCGKGNSN